MGKRLFTFIFKFLWSTMAEICFYLLLLWCVLLPLIKYNFIGPGFESQALTLAVQAIYNLPGSIHLLIILAVLLALSFAFGFVGMVDRLGREVSQGRKPLTKGIAQRGNTTAPGPRKGRLP